MSLVDIFNFDKNLKPPNEGGKFFRGVENILSYFKVRIFEKD